VVIVNGSARVVTVSDRQAGSKTGATPGGVLPCLWLCPHNQKPNMNTIPITERQSSIETMCSCWGRSKDVKTVYRKG